MPETNPLTIEETISLWSDYYGLGFSAQAGQDLAALLRRSPEAMWRAEYEAERAARLDAERGLLWTLRWAVVACAVVCVAAGALALVDGVSRAVARWEVSDGE